MTDRTTLAASELDPPVPDSRYPRLYLIVRQGAGTQIIDVDEGAQIVVGRSSEATVRLDDPKASREHARFDRRGGLLEVVDLGSRNGTRLNGEPLSQAPAPLRSGDVVAVGAAEILVAETTGTRGAKGGTAADAELPGVVVGDPAMAQVFERVRKVALAPTTVLILGETGVGKEVVAEQIHRQGPRAAGPFIPLNCGSVPETLLESELFGHERGAFTGADRRKVGYVEAANGGTLFLDEVGELGPAMQVRLLRVLEERRFMRVGGREEIAADVRIIAATNRDLEAEVQRGRFRQDLYFRLSAFVIRVPPLRERPVEIELFAALFARQLAKRMNVPPVGVDAEALAVLQGHDWPGNVRELRNAIEHAVVLADGGVLRVEHLPESLTRRTSSPGASTGMRAQIAEMERKAITEALDAEDGNQTRAARRLGISRRALLYKLERLGLKR